MPTRMSCGTVASLSFQPQKGRPPTSTSQKERRKGKKNPRNLTQKRPYLIRLGPYSSQHQHRERAGSAPVYFSCYRTECKDWVSNVQRKTAKSGGVVLWKYMGAFVGSSFSLWCDAKEKPWKALIQFVLIWNTRKSELAWDKRKLGLSGEASPGMRACQVISLILWAAVAGSPPPLLCSCKRTASILASLVGSLVSK